MKRLTREQSLLNRINALQRDLYNYASKKEDQSEACKDEKRKRQLKSVAEYAINAGFEMDESIHQMQRAVDLLGNED